VGLPRRAQPFPIGMIVRFMLPLYAYHLALNLLMGVDLFLLKRLVGAFATEAGVDAQAKVASVHAAYYYSLQYLAFIPYQAILAVAFVIFPLVSRSTFENDLSTTQAYVRQTMRLSLIFVAGVAVVFAANPDAVIHVVYPSHYRIGGPALRILSVGMVCFSMFTIINTILNGAGRTGLAILCSLITLAAAAGANQVFIPMAATAEDALVHAAWATSGAMLLGMLLSTALVYRCFSAGFPLASILRIIIAMAAAFAVGCFVPERSKLVTVAECVLVLVVYAGVLVALREFKSEDVARFLRVFARQRSK
jgi:stage V sporulation protein B